MEEEAKARKEKKGKRERSRIELLIYYIFVFTIILWRVLSDVKEVIRFCDYYAYAVSLRIFSYMIRHAFVADIMFINLYANSYKANCNITII